MPGGNTGAAVRVGNTVRKSGGPWVASVHALLRHLSAQGFAGAPSPLGVDDLGRQVLSYIEGETIGGQRP